MDIQYAKDLIAKELIVCLVQEKGMSLQQAFDTLYSSMLFRKLQDTETGLYYQSPLYCFELLEHELKFGKIA